MERLGHNLRHAAWGLDPDRLVSIVTKMWKTGGLPSAVRVQDRLRSVGVETDEAAVTAVLDSLVQASRLHCMTWRGENGASERFVIYMPRPQ